jgi:hypothetical protein
MPYQIEAVAVMAMRRDAERRLHEPQLGCAATVELTEDWARPRAEFQRLTDPVRQHRLPAPEPWPEFEPIP